MSTYQILFDGSPVDEAFYETVAALEIEENADLPGAISLTLPVAEEDGELSWVGDARIAPYAKISVVAAAEEGRDQCIFDGYVLTHKVHVPTGAAGATVRVWGQDATVLMGLTETVKEWSGMSDVEVAEQIFRSYGFQSAPGNGGEAAPTHTEDAHTLMQRSSDADFLRRLARRTGRWFRVVCDDKPGRQIGHFASPSLAGPPVASIGVTDPKEAAASVLDFSWDASRPTAVEARQASLTDNDKAGVSAPASASGLTPLDARDLSEFAGRKRTVLLTATADSDALGAHSAGLLREAGWFVRCEGSAEVDVLRRVLRVGDVVEVVGCGSLLSGDYLVWSVRHSFTPQAHSMDFALVRNAMGPAGS
jgi:hypothetical protein